MSLTTLPVIRDHVSVGFPSTGSADELPARDFKDKPPATYSEFQPSALEVRERSVRATLARQP
eukprot:9937374-Alexandrium_andersonii.AAC.1